MKKCLRWGSIALALAACILLTSASAFAGLNSFPLRAVSANEFQTFVDIFSEMRGPLRSQMLGDKEVNFENADPLRYVQGVKDKRDVKKALKKYNMEWSEFETLMGNILLGYFSIQENSTKVGLIKQLSEYGLLMQSNDIPPEYQPMVKEVLKTDAGASVAAMMLEQFINIPPENVDLARKNKSTLDRMFYTKYWKDML